MAPCLLGVAVGASSCATDEEDVESESHFLCTTDDDCPEGEVCAASHCAPAPNTVDTSSQTLRCDPEPRPLEFAWEVSVEHDVVVAHEAGITAFAALVGGMPGQRRPTGASVETYDWSGNLLTAAETSLTPPPGTERESMTLAGWDPSAPEGELVLVSRLAHPQEWRWSLEVVRMRASDGKILGAFDAGPGYSSEANVLADGAVALESGAGPEGWGADYPRAYRRFSTEGALQWERSEFHVPWGTVDAVAGLSVGASWLLFGTGKDEANQSQRHGVAVVNDGGDVAWDAHTELAALGHDGMFFCGPGIAAAGGGAVIANQQLTSTEGEVFARPARTRVVKVDDHGSMLWTWMGDHVDAEESACVRSVAVGTDETTYVLVRYPIGGWLYEILPTGELCHSVELPLTSDIDRIVAREAGDVLVVSSDTFGRVAFPEDATR